MSESWLFGRPCPLSSSFKMKPAQVSKASPPVQITYPAASTARRQPQQYNDCNNSECTDESKGVKLPAEMCLEILSFLEARDLISLCTVNHMWYNCCKDETLWKELFGNELDAQVYRRVRGSNW